VDKAVLKALAHKAEKKFNVPYSDAFFFFSSLNNQTFHLADTLGIDIEIPNVCSVKMNQKGKQVYETRKREQGVGAYNLHRRHY